MKKIAAILTTLIFVPFISFAASTSFCSFASNLTIGSTGAAVTCLQQALIASGYNLPAGATGYFGAQTQTAVAAWQEANSISPATGYFGAISRAAFNLDGSSSNTTTVTSTIPGCAAGALFSATTGQSCTQTTVTTPSQQPSLGAPSTSVYFENGQYVSLTPDQHNALLAQKQQTLAQLENNLQSYQNNLSQEQNTAANTNDEINSKGCSSIGTIPFQFQQGGAQVQATELAAICGSLWQELNNVYQLEQTSSNAITSIQQQINGVEQNYN